MANIEIDKKEFDNLVRKELSEQKMIEEGSMLGAHWHGIEGKVCKVETYPNRPDLLSVEGLARAYRGFFDIQKGRTNYKTNKGDIKVNVDESVEKVRPFIAGAVVRNLELSEKMINGLIQLQEKMHETMGRRRDKLAIGLHDLSAVNPPFTYRAVKPEKVEFKPLEYDKNMQLGEILEEHEKGRKYSWILEDEDKYPIIEDSNGKILSFPPIINNQLTEVETGTEDIFIDVTGKDRETVTKALNILVTALAERGGQIETIKVNGERLPDLSPEIMELDPEYFREVSGLDLEESEIIERLKMMKHGATGGKKIKVEVPCYRNDVMHQYDLIEDIVIAHRYNNIDPVMPEVDQLGTQKPIQDLTNRVRDIMTGTGALESNTYYLSSKEKLFDRMEIEEPEAIEMENSVSEGTEVLRNLLTPSMLQILHDNRHYSYPQSFFEVSETAELDKSHVGASNKTKLAYVISGPEKDFNNAKKALQVLERDLGIKLEVKEVTIPYHQDARSGKIMLKGEKVGHIGQFSEKVLENWELEQPTAGFELDLEKISENLKK
jgi:phenylalanyl-tRNA synthetase beta chain